MCVGWVGERVVPSIIHTLKTHHYNRVTLWKEDVALLRTELHPNVTLTLGPEIAEGTQVRGYIYVGRSNVDILISRYIGFLSIKCQQQTDGLRS